LPLCDAADYTLPATDASGNVTKYEQRRTFRKQGREADSPVHPPIRNTDNALQNSGQKSHYRRALRALGAAVDRSFSEASRSDVHATPKMRFD